MTAKGAAAVSVSALAMFALWTSPAEAYLDPGTGSMILQGIIGAVAGGLIALRVYWDKIKVFFSPNGAAKTVEGDNPEND